jgi:tetratricopeptide (TPR) repeat protein/CHAT domain-containing protein
MRATYSVWNYGGLALGSQLDMIFQPRGTRSLFSLAGTFVLALMAACPAQSSARANLRPRQTAPQQAAQPLAAQPKAEPSAAGIKKLIDAGHYAEAETASRRLLAQVEAQSAPNSPQAAEVLDLLAESLYRGGKAKAPEAREAADRAISIQEKAFGPDSPEVAKGLRQLANLFSAGDDFAAAKPIYERELTIEEKTLGPDSLDVGKTLGNLGNLYVNTHQFTAAKPLLERALAIKERALGPEHPDVATSLQNIAVLLRFTGDYAKAIELMERAVAIWEKSLGPEHPFVANGLMQLGVLHTFTGDYAGANALYERALRIQEKVLGPRHPELAATTNGMGLMLRHMGDLPNAKAAFERAIAIQEKATGPDSPVSAGIMSNLAQVVGQAGDYAGAKRILEHALAIQEKALGPDDPDVANTLGSLGSFLGDIGDYAEAKSVEERSLAIREKRLGPNHPDVAIALSSLASVLWVMDDQAGSLKLHERALAILEKALGPNHYRVAIELEAIGINYDDMGDYDKAKAYEERSLAVNEKAFGQDSLIVARNLGNLGVASRNMEDFTAAKSFYDRALAILEKHPGEGDPNQMQSTLAGYAGLLWAMGNKKQALQTALRSDNIAEEQLRLAAPTLPERQALDFGSIARSRLYRATEYADGSPDLDSEARIAVWNAVIRSRALVFDEMAARHRSVVRTVSPEVAKLAGDFSAAQQRFATLVMRGAGNIPPQTYRGLIEDARHEKEEAETALAEKNAAFRERQARSKIGFSEVARSLPPDSALVAFLRYVTKERKREPNGKLGVIEESSAYLAFLLRSGETKPALVPLGTADTIEPLVANWREELAKEAMAPGHSPKGSLASYRMVAERLREKVWDPLADHFGGAKRVFVVPDGALDLVNFYSLPLGEESYLIEKGMLIQDLSAERDLVPPENRTQGKGLLALSAPAFNDKSLFASLAPKPKTLQEVQPVLLAQSGTYRGATPDCGDFRTLRFEPLPGSAREVNEIARLWTKRQAMGQSNAPSLNLSGEQASEMEFKREAPGKRILHVATHAFFLSGSCHSPSAPVSRGSGEVEAAAASEENPLLLSGLALAGANHRDAAGQNEEDGILTAEEIAALDLSGADWAVLSACDTGLGKVMPGEGVLGLQRAFQIAGARTVIMSLWPVEDESTRRWMAQLYRQRFERRLDTTESVRLASLEILRQRRTKHLSTHPFYWAAFVAVGDWR